MLPAAGRDGVESVAAAVDRAATVDPEHETARRERAVGAWALTRFRRSPRAGEGASHAPEESTDGFH
jgi:hypothetical protein